MRSSAVSPFATRHGLVIAFLCVALCLAGAYAALGMPSSIFPQTDFPRVVILIDNDVMPANEMMATITRPVEEAMKDIPGVRTVRSKTGRGSAEINVFFTWQTDMVQAELFVQGRLAVVQKALPATASSAVWRLTFAAFPVVGLSLTGPAHSLTELWETARYTLGPRLLRIPGVARTGIVGGRAPEYHVIVDPLRLQAVNLSLAQVTDALVRNNLIAPTGMLEEDYKLYLTVVDGRVHTVEDIENLTVSVSGNAPLAGAVQAVASGAHPIRIKDFARVERSQEPAFNIVTANGVNAVLLNVYSQPDGSTLDIARQLKQELESLKKALPPGMQASVFYDQSLLVGDSIQSVWEAILLGLILSVVILYVFLKNWGATLIAALVIPATVLITLLLLRVMGLGFNLMTLGGIAAAIGLIIDDAIVVVEAVHTKITAGEQRLAAVQQALADIFRPLLASTLTPVVFIPLAFLDGVAGCFFRALALTMVVSLLTSLVLAVTLIPSLAAWWMPTDRQSPSSAKANWLERLIQNYEKVLRTALKQAGKVLTGCVLILALGVWLYGQLESEFLPFMDEGGFVLDYRAPWGTSLAETDRQLRQAETLLRAMPELESYSAHRYAAGLGHFASAHGRFFGQIKTATENRRGRCRSAQAASCCRARN